MEVRQPANAKDAKHYTTERLREEFHISNLFTNDNVKMVYSHIDRIITAGVMPVTKPLALEAGKELAAEYFLQRREMGCINVGGKGTVTVDINLGQIVFTAESPEVEVSFHNSSAKEGEELGVNYVSLTPYYGKE